MGGMPMEQTHRGPRGRRQSRLKYPTCLLLSNEDTTMNDDTPKTVPDYNTQPAQPQFDLSKALVEIDGYHSAFWPLVIVFLALSVLFVYEVSYLRYRKL